MEEAHPELGPVDEVFLALRSQHFVVARELQIEKYRDQFKPDTTFSMEVISTRLREQDAHQTAQEIADGLLRVAALV